MKAEQWAEHGALGWIALTLAVISFALLVYGLS